MSRGYSCSTPYPRQCRMRLGSCIIPPTSSAKPSQLLFNHTLHTHNNTSNVSTPPHSTQLQENLQPKALNLTSITLPSTSPPQLTQPPIPKSPRSYEFMSIENLKTFGQWQYASFSCNLQHYP